MSSQSPLRVALEPGPLLMPTTSWHRALLGAWTHTLSPEAQPPRLSCFYWFSNPSTFRRFNINPRAHRPALQPLTEELSDLTEGGNLPAISTDTLR